MTDVVALVSGHGWHVQDLLRAADRLSIRLHAVPFPTIAAGVGQASPTIRAGEVDLTSTDGVLVRMMPPGSLEQVVFRMDALHRLESMGLPIWNPPRAVETAVDKYLSLARIEAAGLPVPPTWVGESSVDALAAFEALGRDVILKPLFGSEGRGLIRLTDAETAARVFRAIERIGGVLYLQAFLPNPGHDLRVFVLNGRALGAIRRQAADGEWRANVAQGGRAVAVELDDRVTGLAIKAAEAVGAKVCGVDLLPEDRGWVVIEVNAVPGWKAFSAATGLDVATLLLDEFRRACA